MEKAYFTAEPDRIIYLPQSDGSAEVRLRRNITSEETEEGQVWTADEVFFRTRLPQEEVEAQFDSYFIEEPETTMDDLVEALNILTDLMIGEEE